MRTRTTRGIEDKGQEPVLYMAFELGHRKWLIRFGDGRRTRDVEMPARDQRRLLAEIDRAKARFGLAASGPVRSCYEAGWDGFWLDRYLRRRGIENLVVDSASIEVNRRHRRAKTDRVDVGKLFGLLLRHFRGERVWSVVVVPEAGAEDERQLQRDLDQLRKERRQHRNRIEGLLVTQGVVVKVRRGFERSLAKLRIWNGDRLGSELRGRLERELSRLQLVEEQIRGLRVERARRLAAPQTRMAEIGERLVRLRALGPAASWTLSSEFFGWRRFRSGKQVGKLAGMTGTPYNSGSREREQGIDKSGNARVRWMMVQIAWGWLRLQPGSALARWYRERFAGGGSRLKRIGIVALARKLLVALWQYLERGVIPDGAVMKPEQS